MRLGADLGRAGGMEALAQEAEPGTSKDLVTPKGARFLVDRPANVRLSWCLSHDGILNKRTLTYVNRISTQPLKSNSCYCFCYILPRSNVAAIAPAPDLAARISSDS
ncbi:MULTISPECIES: hypothetical protein [Sphingomonas]|uniref:hypothetical protein n=1 Tax=Sphingomonas TaxID=13687 RepID=UPI001E3CD3CF|nr:hypothetical protein [Sphingomonas sp. CCH10-B3]